MQNIFHKGNLVNNMLKKAKGKAGKKSVGMGIKNAYGQCALTCWAHPLLFLCPTHCSGYAPLASLREPLPVLLPAAGTVGNSPAQSAPVSHAAAWQGWALPAHLH